ncbi:hypothetical protein [Neobacillus niacini]|uniref:hypothetical protein n=1 Tax=Neobacillus niacini TaxID=86668 RepID=UPI001C8D9A58|nr:hypothetical protein [Neobacillus niacini]MBY0145725.1 hypothetical protein [Neobacillus niacini]
METIIFLIIVGILSSIFGKGKGKNNPGRNKPFSGKGFDDFRKMVELQMDSIPKKTGQISTGQPVKQQSADIQHNSIQEKFQELKQKPEVDRMQVSQPQPLKVSRIQSEPDNVPLDRPDEKTIINGIIWAEILGEPRAKKPYFSRKR